MTIDVTEPRETPAAATPPIKTNVFARIAGVLFAPAQTFHEIARKPDIVAPMVLLLLFGYLSALLIMPRLDLAGTMATQEAQLRKEDPKISDAQVEQIQRITAATLKVGMWLSPLLMLAFYAAVAGVLLVAFRLMEGEGTFAQALSATLYAWVPMLLHSIILAVVVLARGSFDPETVATLVKSNPAFLVDQKAQPILFSFLSSLDVFSIWSVVLFTFGFAAVSKLSMRRSTAIVLVMWTAMVVIKLGFAALGAAQAA